MKAPRRGFQPVRLSPYQLFQADMSQFATWFMRITSGISGLALMFPYFKFRSLLMTNPSLRANFSKEPPAVAAHPSKISARQVALPLSSTVKAIHSPCSHRPDIDLKHRWRVNELQSNELLIYRQLFFQFI